MNDQAVLQAGGIVPSSSKLGAKADAVDTVVARAYVHPVMPNRTVVRLCADGVAAGDELEMATLGFGAGEDRGEVGKERRRPLGFPGWCLVNDPKNARYALDVVKELKKHARKAKSKPGHAKEAFDAIAAKLSKTVPHFLPSFYEEVGRVFIEHGAITYASQMFGKARQVEAVHALEVDEQHRIDGFLEFALAGAVTTKALSEYGKELSEHHEPKAAYAHFRQLCVQRTLGGMPPWSGMAKDLGRLAKAAKLDVDAEDASLIAEIIESPALAKAAGEFWRAYSDPIRELAKANPTARGVLLNLFPTGNTNNPNTELDDIWLDLLEGTGAVDALIGEGAPEAQPTNGRAAWFDKLCGHTSRGYRNKGLPARVFALLRRMAPALIADGKPIKAQSRYTVDLDLAELALELGVAVEPPENWGADANAWASHAGEPERGRDPVRCAAHPKLAELLKTATISSIGNDSFDRASRGKQGFLSAKRQWLEWALAWIERGGLPAVDEMLDSITKKVTAGTFAEMPDLYARFAAIDLAPALARTLQVGLIDELGWPAMERVVAELDPDGKTEFNIYGAPIAFVIATKTRAVAIVGSERKAEHDLVVPPKHEVIAIRYIGDQFLVVLKEGYSKVRAYWSGSPNDVWDADALTTYSVPANTTVAAVAADGAWLEGTRPIRVGDRILPFAQRIVASDGTTSWINEWKDGEHRWREVAQTGELGRYSWPRWLEDFAADDWKLDGASQYLPAPAWLTQSPLGVANGFIGSRIRWKGGHRNRKQEGELESIDGAKVSTTANITDLLAFPDGGERRPLGQDWNYGRGMTVVIHAPGCTFVGSKAWGGDKRYCRGQSLPISTAFLHNYTARDLAGSVRLHAVTDDDARALLAAAPVLEEVQDTRPSYSRSTPMPEPAIPADLPGMLPEVTHPLLRKGVASVAITAKQLVARRDKLVVDRDPTKAAKVASVGASDKDVLAMLNGWGHTQYAQDGSAWAQIERVGEVFASADRSDRIVKGLGTTTLDWSELAVTPSALVFLALAIGTPADKRLIAVELYEHLIATLPVGDKLRVLHVHGDLAGEDPNLTTEFQVRWVGGNAYAIRQWGWSGHNYHVVEYAPAGQFKLLPGLIVDHEIRGAAITPATELREAVTAGKTSWNPDVVDKLATAAGLTPSEAAFLWAGAPNHKDRNANFLDKEVREAIGLKAAQAALARDALAVPRLMTKIAVIDAAGRAGVAALLDGRAADAFAAEWTSRFGQRVQIPEELIAEADAQGMSGSPAIVLGWILGGEDSPELTADGIYAFDAHGTLIRASKPEPLIGQTKYADDSPHFDATMLQMLVTYVPFLYAELPVGHALRPAVVKAYELALKRLENPALWLNAAASWMDKEKAEAITKQLEGLGGELLPVSEGRTFRRLHGGAVVSTASNATVVVRPIELDAKARAWFDPLTKQLNSYMSTGRDLDYLRSDELRAMMERITDTPVPAGGWEQNPVLSVPKLVDKVMKELKLSREAAALYLQYLVLLWPTPKAIAEYNGWKPKQVADAQAELLEKELILEAKRERAQRGHFLPGGWEAHKSPHPPMESWKQRNIYHRPAAKYQATAPFHLLFEHAWKRIQEGDEPRYEEVKR